MDVPPEMTAAVQDNGPQLLTIAGVRGIDIGFTELNGIPTEDIAIRVFVSDINNIPDGIPDTLAGFPVVILQGNPQPDADLRRLDPLVGGVSIALVKGIVASAGTMGGIARDSSTGELRGLTNAHVVRIGAPGDTIQQPEPNPNPNPANVIGTLLRSVFPTTPSSLPPFLATGFSDAAVFTITRSAAAAVADIGPVNGTAIPRLGDRVMKRGKT